MPHDDPELRQRGKNSKCGGIYIKMANPAIYKRPAMADTVSLESLTRLLRYYDPSLTDSSAFERLRKAFWAPAS